MKNTVKNTSIFRYAGISTCTNNFIITHRYALNIVKINGNSVHLLLNYINNRL